MYLINLKSKTWRREGSDDVRTPDGTFTHINNLEIGSTLRLICPPHVEGAVARVIYSTPIQSIEEVD